MFSEIIDIDKQAHIVRSAQPLFAQFGLKKVTTDDIAREARVSKATVYKFFKNKSDIFDCVIEEEAEQLIRAIGAAVSQEAGAVEKLRAHLMVRLSQVKSFVNFYRVTQESWGDYWPHIAHIRKDFLAREQDLVAGILEDGVKTGELQVRDTRKAGLALVLGLASVEYQWSVDDKQFNLVGLVDMMLEMMVEGIRKRKED